MKECNDELDTLKSYLKNYQSLGSSKKKLWDRLRFRNKLALRDIRIQLSAHKGSINLFLTSLGLRSLGRIEKCLDDIVREIRSETEFKTLLLKDQHGDANLVQWSELKGYLQLRGLSQCDLDAHPHGITAYLQELLENREDVNAESNQTTYKLGSSYASYSLGKQDTVPAEIYTDAQKHDKNDRLRKWILTR